MMEKTIKIPKVLLSGKAKYKIIEQTVNVGYYEDYTIIHHHLILKLPKFVDKEKLLYDIKDICIKMKDDKTNVHMMGWNDVSCNSYEICISTILT